MAHELIFGGHKWQMSDRGYDLPGSALIEELPEVEEYRWFLHVSSDDGKSVQVQFSDLDNAHAYISGRRITLDYIEPYARGIVR